MADFEISRDEVISAFSERLSQIGFVHALWSAGADSFGRRDEWSDIDLYVVVDDDGVEETIGILDEIVESLSGYDIKFRLPEPTWHGHSQVFYRLNDASPFMFLDIAVIKRSAKDKFLQSAVHGKPVVFFDKIGIVKDDAVDRDAFADSIMKRLELICNNFELFKVLPIKELKRGHDIEALAYYNACILRPLVDALRMKYCPHHHNFGMTCLSHELPQNVYARLKSFYFVASPADIEKKTREAEKWFFETAGGITRDGVLAKLTGTIC